jgi:hypothetical protein
MPPVSLSSLLTPEERKNPKLLLEAIQNRFLFSSLKSKDQETLLTDLNGKKTIDTATALRAIRLLMSTTQYQLT